MSGEFTLIIEHTTPDQYAPGPNNGPSDPDSQPIEPGDPTHNHLLEIHCVTEIVAGVPRFKMTGVIDVITGEPIYDIAILPDIRTVEEAAALWNWHANNHEVITECRVTRPLSPTEY